MIIVDTGIWVDQLRRPNEALNALAFELRALLHPYVLGELALGSLPRRRYYLGRMSLLPQPPIARHADVMRLIEAQRLYSSGIGYVDAHLLASTRLLPGAQLWTGDKRLLDQAQRLRIAFTP